MTITVRVRNHAIELPAYIEIADGSEVQVIVPDLLPSVKSSDDVVPDWLQNSIGSATTGLSTADVMKLTRGED